MANTVNLDNLTEHHDPPEEVKAKCEEIARLIRDGKHVIFFTGAGISTSAKIPDFRGPDGVWTRQAQGRAAPQGVEITQATPTFCHMALAELTQRKLCKYIVSQNIDGLHRRSGVRREDISELHGNCYLEVCWGCHRDFLRTFDVSARVGGSNCKECLRRVPRFCHCTGRKCPGCTAMLKDSIIHFSENLPADALGKAVTHGETADVCVVLGSSLTVAPACHIPRDTARRGGKLVIVNLQSTPYDDLAAIRVHAKTDEVMEHITKALGVAVPAFEGSAAAAEEQKRMREAEVHQRADRARVDEGNEEAEAATEEFEDKGGYVNPKTDCPHVPARDAMTIMQAKTLIDAGCHGCADHKENWFCVTCLQVGCSRYVSGHASEHGAAASHPVATSLSDLNTWCYECGTYVVADALEQMRATLHLAKFGVLPPGR